MPPKKASTIYDVAKQAGVSIATVSRMLNVPDKVNGETRERILAAIDALGFVPKAEGACPCDERDRTDWGHLAIFYCAIFCATYARNRRGIIHQEI